MNSPADNPSSVIGHNKGPDAAKMVAEALERDYAETVKNVSDLLDQARDLPKEIGDDEQMGAVAKIIRGLRDTTSRLTAFHKAEKEPHLRAGQAVDSFFFSLIDKCARRDRKNKPGAADVLQARLDDYNQRKLRAEQERRRREAEEADRIAREKREAEEKAAREAEEARLAAERARKPEHIEAKGEIATVKEDEASTAKIEADLAAEKAEEAYVGTLARPADIVRTRVDEGPLVTMQSVGYAEIEDSSRLDKAILWPFISEDSKEKALRAWAKTTGYRQQMDGAAIGKRNRSAIR